MELQLIVSHSVGSGPDQTARELRLREFAAEGVHQAATQALQQYISPPARVVELGAGAGAFSDRLRALGYIVTATDVDPVEVIEHLRHPWKFFEQCRSVLRAGGMLLLSTPNVSSKWSRAYFLAEGVPLGFGRRNLLAIGHINPLTSLEIDHIASSTGFELVRRIPVGSFSPPEAAGVRVRFRHFAFFCFVALLRPVMRNLEQGYCHVIIYRKV